MKLTSEERAVLDRKKQDGSACSDLLIYGAIQFGEYFGDSEFRPAVSRSARVEVSRAAENPAELAKVLARYVAKSKTPVGMLEVICAAVAYDFPKSARGKHKAACAKALQTLIERTRTKPELADLALAVFSTSPAPAPARPSGARAPRSRSPRARSR